MTLCGGDTSVGGILSESVSVCCGDEVVCSVEVS